MTQRLIYSGLFFSFNDHAEGLTPEHWRQQNKIVEQCNVSNSDPVTNDLVVFPGWEWTQIGQTKEFKATIFFLIKRDQPQLVFQGNFKSKTLSLISSFFSRTDQV